MLKKPPANAEDMGLIPGLGRLHMLRSNKASEPQLLWSPGTQPQLLSHLLQLLKPAVPPELELCKEKPLQWEGHTQPPLATTREKPTQQGRCSTAKTLKIIIKNRDFPGGPVAKAPCSQRRGPRV